MNKILDKHTPLQKKLDKDKLKFITKPWITTGLQSISIKNKLFSDFINKKRP